jgi:exonuclease III
MKCLYWNIRGITNTSSRLALRRLIIVEKPDLVLVAEPWVCFHSFHDRWLHRLGYKLFALNNRDNLIPNLWCICKVSITPVVLEVDDQFVAFTCTEFDNMFGIAAVYASTCYIKRRQLWNKLSVLGNLHKIAWSFLGDFNVILGHHEYRGSFLPANLPMAEFQDWTSANELLHLPTRGAWFTWSNGRRGRAFTEKRLDRAICNMTWMNSCTMVSCSTLIKNKSDHFPILVNFQFSSTSFASQFKFLKMWS